MSKITQARARADRRELKDLRAKMYRHVESTHPGTSLCSIRVDDVSKGIFTVSRRLGFDIVYRLDSEENRLTAFAVKRS